MKNRSDQSPLSLMSLWNTVRLPIEARVRVLLSPQHHRPARSITMLAIAGGVACAIGLVSVQVKAGQAAAERAEIARAQAELDATLDAKSRAKAGQSSAAETASKAQKSARSEEAAALRRKLDILEQLLVRNQEENAELRRQLKTLLTQQKDAAAIHGELGRDNIAQNKILERLAQQRAVIDKQDREAELKAVEAARAAKAGQEKALEAMVKDRNQQMLLLQDRAKQAEELYRSGFVTSQESDRRKAEADAIRAQLKAAQAQVLAERAGQKATQQEQNVAQLRLEIAEQEAQLRLAQANLARVKAQYDAGTVSAAEVKEVEARISSIQVTIDQFRLKLNQKGGR